MKIVVIGGTGLIGSTTVAILRQVHHLFGRCAHRQRHAPSAGALS